MYSITKFVQHKFYHFLIKFTSQFSHYTSSFIFFNLPNCLILFFMQFILFKCIKILQMNMV